jgi:hypothetical protein
MCASRIRHAVFVVVLLGLTALLAGCGSSGSQTSSASKKSVTPTPSQPSLPITSFKVLSQWANDPGGFNNGDSVQVRIVSVDGSCFLEANDLGNENGWPMSTFTAIACPA